MQRVVEILSTHLGRQASQWQLRSVRLDDSERYASARSLIVRPFWSGRLAELTKQIVLVRGWTVNKSFRLVEMNCLLGIEPQTFQKIPQSWQRHDLWCLCLLPIPPKDFQNQGTCRRMIVHARNVRSPKGPRTQIIGF